MPKKIEKRIFTCQQCGYSVQVLGESYFDYGCNNYIATFICRKCNTLFESVISKMECYEFPEVTYNLADEIICLSCGTNDNRVWNFESGTYPKCGNKMTHLVDGEIKVHHLSS
jgi:hypothetical protein